MTPDLERIDSVSVPTEPQTPPAPITIVCAKPVDWLGWSLIVILVLLAIDFAFEFLVTPTG